MNLYAYTATITVYVAADKPPEPHVCERQAAAEARDNPQTFTCSEPVRVESLADVDPAWKDSLPRGCGGDHRTIRDRAREFFR